MRKHRSARRAFLEERAKNIRVHYRDVLGNLVPVGRYTPRDWNGDRERINEEIEEVAHAWNRSDSGVLAAASPPPSPK